MARPPAGRRQKRMNKRQGGKRPEVERQELIAELRRLRNDGLNVDRQEAILATLRGQFELGWPEAKVPRRRSSENGVQA